MKTMKINSSILAAIMLVFWMMPGMVMACVEISDPLEISVSGATASPSEGNYYVLHMKAISARWNGRLIRQETQRIHSIKIR